MVNDELKGSPVTERHSQVLHVQTGLVYCGTRDETGAWCLAEECKNTNFLPQEETLLISQKRCLHCLSNSISQTCNSK